MSSTSKSVGTAVTAGIPLVGSAGISEGQHPGHPLAELDDEDDDELEEPDDEAVEDFVELLSEFEVCDALLSVADSVGSSSGSVLSASVLESFRRSSVKSGSGLSLLRLSFSELRTSSAQPTILVMSPARCSRPEKGFGNLLVLLAPLHEPFTSEPPRSSNKCSALLMVFSTSCNTSALIVGIVKSTP